MIVDTSAIMAILMNGAGHEAYAEGLIADPSLAMSAGTYLECAIVVDRHRDPALGREFDRLIAAAGVSISPVTAEQVRIARSAYRDFGRGSGHPARLNFGDCFAYALAIERDEPLLYQGNDFSHTDVRNALAER
jgi:ribonuclease VapC